MMLLDSKLIIWKRYSKSFKHKIEDLKFDTTENEWNGLRKIVCEVAEYAIRVGMRGEYI